MRPTHPVLWLLALCTAVLGLTPSSPAQPDDQKVQVRATPDRPELAPGEKLLIAVVMEHGEELHTWPHAGVELPPAITEGFNPTHTTIEVTDLPGNLKLTGIQWPATRKGHVPNPEGGEPIESPLYLGTATAYLVLEAQSTLSPGDLVIAVKVRYQACNDSVCFRAETVKLDVAVKAVAQPTAARSNAALFAGFSLDKVIPTTLAPPRTPQASPSNHAAPTPAPAAAPQNPQSTAAPRQFLGFSIGSSVLILFLLAILGGAILNLTPCVLPIIPIKVMTLVEHAGTPQRRVVLGLWMAVGVVAFWTGVGLPVLIAKLASNTSIDPTRFIFGTWWVTLGLGTLIALMGLGIMGLFTLNLPQSVYLINPKADTARGSFFFGVMTGVLGLPCFGFVAGGLLAGSAGLPASTIFAIFVGLGIGMAAPYLVLSINPALVRHLPRTGPGSELVKQVMGFLLLAAAAYFIAVGIKTFLAVKPWYEGSMPFWAAAIFVTIGAVWLLLRTWQISKGPARRVVLSLTAILFAWGAIAFSYTFAQSDKRDYDARQAALKNAAPGQLIPGAWTPFDRALLDKARAQGSTVMVDFTADWCLTCKSLKRGILDQEPVRTRLKDVVLLEADVTADEAPAWDFHKELGQTGVPTLVIYGPGIDQPLVFNAYTPETVIDALNRAATKPLTQKTP